MQPERRSRQGRRSGWGRAAGIAVAFVAACLSMAAGPAAAAVETQFHGFLAKGFVLSDHYDFFGDSTDGETRYNEVGATIAFQLLPNLSASAEGYVRDAGTADSGKARWNFALVDYRFLSTPTGNLGVRAGRVKNPFGFYNDTRDVIFTRPSILLPQSVYNETQGTSKLLFSSDGGQLYGDRTLGGHVLSFVSTIASDRRLDSGEKRLLIDLGGIPFDLEITRLWNVMLNDEFGPWRMGLGYTDIRFAMQTADDVGITGDFDVRLWIASLAWEGERWSFTTEYSITPNEVDLRLGDQRMHTTTKPDGGYVQAQYRATPQWTLLARYDLSYSDRSDRSGRKFARDTGEPRYEMFGRDLTLGANWRPDPRWGVWGEVHVTDGTVSVQALENPDPPTHRWWTLFLLMVAVKF